jgi:hypothetical protein
VALQSGPPASALDGHCPVPMKATFHSRCLLRPTLAASRKKVTFQLLLFDGLDVAQWQAAVGAETLFEKIASNKTTVQSGSQFLIDCDDWTHEQSAFPSPDET